MTASQPRNFILHREPDRTRPTVLANLHALIDALDPSKVWNIVIKLYRKPRSSVANAYLWASYALVTRELGFNADDWHEEMCIRYFGKVETPKPGGRVIVTPIRTTTTDAAGERDVLTGDEFWQFVEFMRRVASEGGVYVPDPTPRERDEIIDEWRKAA